MTSQQVAADGICTLNRSIGPRSTDWTIGIGLSKCRIGRERFMMGKWLEIACFRTSVIPIRVVFPRFSRKKNRATSQPESKPTLFNTDTE